MYYNAKLFNENKLPRKEFSLSMFIQRVSCLRAMRYLKHRTNKQTKKKIRRRKTEQRNKNDGPLINGLPR